MEDAGGVSVASLTAAAPGDGDTGCESPPWGPRPFMSAAALLVITLFLDTDIFLHDVLGNLGTTLRPNGAPNVKGAVLRALILVALFAVVTLLIAHNVL